MQRQVPQQAQRRVLQQAQRRVLQRAHAFTYAFDFEGHRFTVEEMEGHRIAKVQIEKLETAAMGKAGD